MNTVKEEKIVNAIMTNFNNMVKEGDDRLDIGFLNYCLGRLNKENGQSRRYIMCKLLMKGLEAEYGERLEIFRRGYTVELNKI